MPDIESGLQATGGITKALIDALNQLEAAVTASLTNPDGTPSGTAVYMHQPMGRPVDPKMYARPWTPAGFAYAATNDDGSMATPAPGPAAPAAAGGPTPAPPGAQAASVAVASEAAVELNSAMMTARLVDDMLMVTDKGIATSWPDRHVSIEYFTVLEGMQAEPVPEPSDDIKKRIADAEKVLYIVDANGDYVGYTPLSITYRRNQKALADARTAYAAAYAASMASPAAAATWPVVSSGLQATVDQAYNDFRDMGAQKVEDAQASLQSIGGSAVAALIAKARKMYDDYNVGGTQIAEKTLWSYIDPVSWWDHTDQDLGAIRIDASSDNYNASSAGGGHSYGDQFYHDTSESNSGGAGYSFLGFGAEANVEHDSQHHDAQQFSGQSGWSYGSDSSTTAKVSFEYFLASCERPWFLGDLFHIEGWYLAGGKKDSISDGSITGQIDKPDRLLPMVPKGFVVIRNVTIEADSFGEAQSSFESLADASTQTTDASHTSYGGKVGYFGLGGHFQHDDSESSGAFTTTQDTSNSWSYSRTATGGKLQLFGTQIAGWIGQIQPASPYKDDPALGAKTEGQASASTTDASASAAPASGTDPAATPVAVGAAH